MNDLKDCPFCGGKAEIDEPEEGFFRVRCLKDSCSMGYPDAWYDSKESLIRDWNRRPEQGWVKVEEGLPPESVPCFVARNGDSMPGLFSKSQEKFFHTWNPYAMMYEGEIKGVTHYIVMPPAPEEE